MTGSGSAADCWEKATDGYISMQTRHENFETAIFTVSSPLICFNSVEKDGLYKANVARRTMGTRASLSQLEASGWTRQAFGDPENAQMFLR